MLKRIKVTILAVVFPLFANSQAGFLEDIFNEVDQDSLVSTLEELTGEKPFILNGNSITMPNRYYVYKDHAIVQEYCIEKLKKLGYSVETEGFSFDPIVDISFSPENPLRGWFVTHRQQVYATTNGGKSWCYLNHIDPDLTAINSVNDTLVFILGKEKIFKRSDSINWEQIDLSELEYKYFKDCFFLNENTGWVYGEGSLLKTTDGGDSWSSLSNEEEANFQDIYFINENKGWFLKDNKIFATINGDANWIRQDSMQVFPELSSIHMFDSLTGLVLGKSGEIYRTDNGGDTWTSQEDLPGDKYNEIDFIDENNGLITNETKIFISNDGGNNWTESRITSTSEDYNIYAGALFDSARVLVVGEENAFLADDRFLIAETETGGETWTSLLKNIEGLPNRNIIATKTGTSHSDECLVLSAHYDSKSTTPGADDNGSGVAALYEAVRILSNYNFNYTIKFILFDAEEIGLVGSSRYAENIDLAGLNSTIKGVINFDMIGYDGNSDGVFNLYSDKNPMSQKISNTIISNINAYNLDLSPNPIINPSFLASDHYNFWKIDVPAILVIEDYDDLNPDYHAPGDVISNMDLDYYTSIVKASITALAELASDTSDIVTSNQRNNYIEPFVADPFPNPVTSMLQIPLYLRKSMDITIQIYAVTGQLVATVHDGFLSEGKHEFSWIIQESRGRKTSPGIYFVRYRTTEKLLTKKIIVR